MKRMEVWSKCQLSESILFHCTERNFMDMQKLGPRGRSSSINPGPGAAVECKTSGVARGGMLVLGIDWCIKDTPPRICVIDFILIAFLHIFVRLTSLFSPQNNITILFVLTTSHLPVVNTEPGCMFYWQFIYDAPLIKIIQYFIWRPSRYCHHKKR